jgi:hypothetical protein
VGILSVTVLLVLNTAYLVVLVIGLATLPSPHHPIQSPWFTIMELLIVAMGPALVTLPVAVHAQVSAARRPAALAAIAFMALAVGITCSVHFLILTLGRTVAVTHPNWARMLFAFEWPSVAYALDILAWDVFFPFATLCMAVALPQTPTTRIARWILWGSTALSFIGLAGAPMANMSVRNIGIIGYALVFPIGIAFLLRFFKQGAE